MRGRSDASDDHSLQRIGVSFALLSRSNECKLARSTWYQALTALASRLRIFRCKCASASLHINRYIPSPSLGRPS